jgi:hypothetical protein
MMSETHYGDEVYNMNKNDDGIIELQAMDADAACKSEPLLSEAPMVLLHLPDQWFDLKEPLPTDKEFHQWIRQQTRREKLQRRRGGRRSTCSFDDSSDDDDTNHHHQELLSAFGDAIKEVSANLLQGIKIRQEEQESRKENNMNNPHEIFLLDERRGFVINNFDGDCFGSKRTIRESSVGMELPVMS